MTNYHEYFQTGDVIEFNNDDLPAWGSGLWRVTDVTETSVRLQPLKADKSVDEARDREQAVRIEHGGLISERRRRLTNQAASSGSGSSSRTSIA
jgi:hypothetical protein